METQTYVLDPSGDVILVLRNPDAPFALWPAATGSRTDQSHANPDSSARPLQQISSPNKRRHVEVKEEEQSPPAKKQRSGRRGRVVAPDGGQTGRTGPKSSFGSSC